jgi:hypothetical protein
MQYKRTNKEQHQRQTRTGQVTSKEQQHTNNEHEQYYLTKTRGNYRTPETVHEQRATDKSINKTPTHMARTKCDEQKHNGAKNTRTNDT